MYRGQTVWHGEAAWQLLHGVPAPQRPINETLAWIACVNGVLVFPSYWAGN